MTTHHLFSNKSVTAQDQPLVFIFERFHEELLRQKDFLSHQTYPQSLQTSTNTNEDHLKQDINSERSFTEIVQNNLKRCIEEQTTWYRHHAIPKVEADLEETRYLMAVLSDEIFLHFPFDGVKSWHLSILEGQLFHTQIAGELVFRRLDALLASRDLLKKDLAKIYLFILGLGFRGQYNRPEDQGLIKAYQDQLFYFIQGHTSKFYTQAYGPLQSQPYEYTLIGTPSKGLADLKTWIKYGYIFVVIYLAFSHFIWYSITTGLKKDVQKILHLSRSS